MKEIYTPYVRPDGIIVGIKGKAPEKPNPKDYMYKDSDGDYIQNNATYLPALRRYEYDIASGHPFEDQEWAFRELVPFIDHDTLLPPIELDVTEVRQVKNPMSGEWEQTEMRGSLSQLRTVLRIAKEEQKPTEEATETQEELWGEVYNNGILWYRQELIHEYLLKQFTIQRKTK